MKILVLGGNGFIGSHLVDKLLCGGHEVRVFDRREELYRKPLNQVHYCFGEFGNRKLLKEALNKIDIVIHLVSSSLPKTSNDDPAFDVQSNVIETLYLLENCVKRNVKKVIFLSSGGTIYGFPESLPVTENHKTNPICSYGITKLTIEKYLYLFKELYNLDYVILRPSNPYGPRQNPFGIQGVISVFLGKLLRNEPIEIWGDGTIVRDYLYIEDLVEAISLAVSSNSSHRIYNIGSGFGYTLNDILKTINKITGLDANVLYSNKRHCDIPSIYLDITVASKELNWLPLMPLEAGIKRTWDFIKDNLVS